MKSIIFYKYVSHRTPFFSKRKVFHPQRKLGLIIQSSSFPEPFGKSIDGKLPFNSLFIWLALPLVQEENQYTKFITRFFRPCCNIKSRIRTMRSQMQLIPILFELLLPSRSNKLLFLHIINVSKFFDDWRWLHPAFSS